MTSKDIKIRLLQQGVNQAAIADDLEVSRAAVSRVIKGESESAKIKKEIARKLNDKVENLWPKKDRTA